MVINENKVVTKERADELFRKAIRIVSSLGYTSKYPIKRDLRFYPATSYFGSIRRRKRNGSFYYEITISTNHFANGEKSVLETLIHEVIHSVDGCWNHKDKFKQLAKEVKLKYDYDISRTGSLEDTRVLRQSVVNEYKYIAKCNCCGQIIKRKRMSKFIKEMEYYSCGNCGGDFELQ